MLERRWLLTLALTACGGSEGTSEPTWTRVPAAPAFIQNLRFDATGNVIVTGGVELGSNNFVQRLEGSTWNRAQGIGDSGSSLVAGAPTFAQSQAVVFRLDDPATFHFTSVGNPLTGYVSYASANGRLYAKRPPSEGGEPFFHYWSAGLTDWVGIPGTYAGDDQTFLEDAAGRFTWTQGSIYRLENDTPTVMLDCMTPEFDNCGRSSFYLFSYNAAGDLYFAQCTDTSAWLRRLPAGSNVSEVITELPAESYVKCAKLVNVVDEKLYVITETPSGVEVGTDSDAGVYQIDIHGSGGSAFERVFPANDQWRYAFKDAHTVYRFANSRNTTGADSATF